MRENCSSGSVGRAPGNRCLYPEPDAKKRGTESEILELSRHSMRALVSFSLGKSHAAISNPFE